MEENKKQYLSLLSEIIAKEIVVLGPDMAILKAHSVDGLIVDNNGNVTDITGFVADAVKKLVDAYVELSGQATKNIIDSIFEKYPQIRRVG